MSSKFLLILFSALLIFPVYAQKMRYRPRRPATTTQTQQQQQQTSTTSASARKTPEKKTPEQKPASTAPARTPAPVSPPMSGGTGRFDPKKPGLTQKYVDYIMDDLIRKELLERKFPSKLPNYRRRDGEDEEDAPEKKPEKFRILSQIDYTILLNRFRSLTNHFELTEVTNIRSVWFERYLAELSKFEPIVYQISLAVQSRSNERYSHAVELFKKQQEVCLRMLKERKPGLTAEERVALQQKNMQIRIENRRKQRQAELQRRQAELKRRQEQQKPAPAPAAPPARK